MSTVIAVSLEQTFPVSDHDWVDEQAEFVEQALLQQEPDEGGAGSDSDVLALLLLELRELGDDVAADQRRGSQSGWSRVLDTTTFGALVIISACGMRAGRYEESAMDYPDDEWQRKGAPQSDKTACEESGGRCRQPTAGRTRRPGPAISRSHRLSPRRIRETRPERWTQRPGRPGLLLAVNDNFSESQV